MTAIRDAQAFMRENGIDAWLTRDYRNTNPIFWQAYGASAISVTRPVWLLIPSTGNPQLVVHDVDAGSLNGFDGETNRYTSRESMVGALERLLASTAAEQPVVAMEYSELSHLPRVSRVDAGSIELVRSLGARIVSSGDLFQHATERWTDSQLETHRFAVERLTRIAKEAFKFAGENVRWALTEHDLAEHIRGRFDRLGLEFDDGPVVAFNEHSSDPHYQPSPSNSAVIRREGWLLVDLWGRKKWEAGDEHAVSADITWVAKFGGEPTDQQHRVFDTVRGARDAAFDFIHSEFRRGNSPQGWQVDRVARDLITQAGYGDYFVHRLGHSLGTEVHSNGVNLDDWETHDTRRLIEGIGVTIEPGIYLPEFGTRLEMDVFIGPDGPEATGEVQTEIFRVET